MRRSDEGVTIQSPLTAFFPFVHSVWTHTLDPVSSFYPLPCIIAIEHPTPNDENNQSIDLPFEWQAPWTNNSLISFLNNI